MEIILAIVVASAVIFFGALISTGNERQRKAIDALHEQLASWALQDIRIKREKMIREVQVPDSLSWLNNIATNASGIILNLQSCNFNDNPSMLVCESIESAYRVIFSPHSLREIRDTTGRKNNKISRYKNLQFSQNFNGKIDIYRLSILNSSILFDLELPIVWKSLTTQDITPPRHFWMYVIHQSG